MRCTVCIINRSCMSNPPDSERKKMYPGMSGVKGKNGPLTFFALTSRLVTFWLSLFLFLSFVSWKEKGVGGGRGRRFKEWKICFKVLSTVEYFQAFFFFPPQELLVLFCFLKEAVAFQVRCLDLRYKYLTEYHYQHCNLYVLCRWWHNFFIFLTKMNVVSLKNTVEE